jgi:rod shape-determining protein MreC
MKWPWFRNKVALGIAVAGLAVVLGLAGWLRPVGWIFDHTLGYAVRPLVGVGVTTGEFFGNLGRIKDLASDNQKLTQENLQLRQRLAADSEVRQDNEALRQQLGLGPAAGLQQVSAEVVAFQPDSYRQFVTTNRGSKQGLAVGLAVMSDGVLVGTLSDVQSNSARVVLVSDPEFRLVAKDQESGALGVVHGQLGSGLVMEKIAQTDTIKAGDSIVTAGLGGQVPAGLLVGQVRSVDEHVNAVFQSAQVATPVRASGLRFVFVVRP